eukprot:CAMPEP_0194362154 /NCGR_PEP_ID=MMETSP0174-20130528/9855_1 /TAXON_ID=216777 /ORGANISM="Proboscia alata, Strain PI-D3" /LENGTH=418 /DNA_ID=CAMNT_0039134829 /DNA_START=81 /DNA_END=1337 /DNA_ORIENTATION=+
MTMTDEKASTNVSPLEHKEKEKKTSKTKKRKLTSKTEKTDKSKPPVTTLPNANDDESTEMMQTDDNTSPSKKHKRLSTKEKRALKKSEKQSLTEKIPSVDEHGISYTKLQTRKMLRRVKRGLPPVPTPEEERLLQQERKLQEKLEELELGGMIVSKPKEKVVEEPEADADDNADANVESEPNESVKSYANCPPADEPRKYPPKDHSLPPSSPTNKKAIPLDYVCFACKNDPSNGPLHWIYNCPSKVTKKGCNAITKKKRGSLSSNECKIFVSGLPFTVTGKDVEDYFGLKLGVGEGLSKAIQCQLLTFKDTKRCNGQAYLVFATKDMVETALTLHKAVYDGQTSNDPKKKTKKDTGKDVNAKPEKERWLAVTRCVNRIESKKMMRQRRWMENGKRASHMQKWEKEQTQTPKQDGAKFE